LQQQSEQIAAVDKIARTPKRRKAIRDANGVLVGSVEEPVSAD